MTFFCSRLFFLALSLLALAPNTWCIPLLPFETDSTPAHLLSRTVYNPKVTKPDSRTTWMPGSHAIVTWDTSKIPHDASNLRGQIVLGYLEDNEHLDVDHPLADDIDLRAGHVTVRVPFIKPRRDYIIVLLGDSGNRSQKFTISSE